MLDLQGALALAGTMRSEVSPPRGEAAQLAQPSLQPGMDPGMAVEQEAVVQEDKCRAGWDRTPSAVELPTHQHLPICVPCPGAIPGLYCDVLPPGQCLSFPLFSRVLGPELFQQWKTEDLGQSCQSWGFSSPHLLHFVCWEVPLRFFSTFWVLWPNPQGPASSTAWF